MTQDTLMRALLLLMCALFMPYFAAEAIHEVKLL